MAGSRCSDIHSDTDVYLRSHKFSHILHTNLIEEGQGHPWSHWSVPQRPLPDPISPQTAPLKLKPQGSLFLQSR